MNRTMDLLAKTDTLLGTLAGGRAPLHWQRLLAQKTAALDHLRRSSDWLAALVRVCPALRAGPLLGERLAVLTGARFDTPEEQADGQSARPPSVPIAVRSQDRDNSSAEVEQEMAGRRRLRASLQPTASGSKPPASQPVRPLDEASLRRAAGEIPVMVSETRVGRPMGLLKPRSREVPPLTREPAIREQWLYRLAQRAGRALTLPLPLAGGVIGHQPQQPATGEYTGENAAALLRAWSQPLPAQAGIDAGQLVQILHPANTEGMQPAKPSKERTLASSHSPGQQASFAPDASPALPVGELLAWQPGGDAPDRVSPAARAVPLRHRIATASREGAAVDPVSALAGGQILAQSPDTRRTLAALLARLAGQERVELDGSERHWQRSTARPGATPSVRTADSLAPRDQTIQGEPNGGQALRKPARRETKPQEYDDPEPALADWIPASRQGVALPDDVHGATESPLLATMSPLRPAFLPSTPEANASAQRESPLGEWATTSAEMDALAAMIKRILDEEARRHGIDV